MSKILPTLIGGTLLLSACSVSTANISDVKACTQIKDNQCTEDIATFPADTEEIFVTALLNNAPEDTKTTFSWRYLEDNFDIDSITLNSTETSTTLQSSLNMPDQGWPRGKYEVVITLDTDNSEAIHKEFTIQ